LQRPAVTVKLANTHLGSEECIQSGSCKHVSAETAREICVSVAASAVIIVFDALSAA
jgi:hypothetical protein